MCRLERWCIILFLKHNNLTFTLPLSWPCLNTLKYRWINYRRENLFIDGCHRPGKNNDRVIVKFTRRKDSKQVFQAKKDLKYLTAYDFDLPGATKIFVNQSLCPYYRILWSKTKRLQSMGKVNSFFISGRTKKIKIDENSKPLAITHLDSLSINFHQRRRRRGLMDVVFNYYIVVYVL